MNTPKIQLLVKDKSGTSLGEFSRFFNLKFSDILNNYGELTFDIPVDSKEATSLISLRRFEIHLVRDGKTIWSGEQVNADITLEANGPNLLTITCFTYYEMLNTRVPEEFVRYTQIDQAEILKDLIVTSQAKTDGDFGLTFASITPTKLRDREYKRDLTLMDAHINMSNVIDGIDSWIDSEKVVHYAQNRGIDKSNLYSLEWGVNIQRLKISDNFSSPANTAYAIGTTDGFTPITQPYTDTAARRTYNLRELVLTAIDVSESDTLLGKAQDLVNKNKNQVRTISIDQLPNTVPNLGQLSVGDSVNTKTKKGRYDINRSFRIIGYQCKIGSVGEEYVTWIVADIAHEETGVS